MIEIYPNLYIGNQDDYEQNVKNQNDWAIVHACKDPYHRQALGYTGKAASKEHPEYLMARRSHRLILNLIDTDNPDWISPTIIDEALLFIDENLLNNKKVLVHCNQGISRSAGIGLLFLARHGKFKAMNMADAEAEYKIVYPMYNPALGMQRYIQQNWKKYNTQ